MGGKFKVSFYVRSLPAGIFRGADGYEDTLQYTGVTSTQTQDTVDQTAWPSCVKKTGGEFSPGQVHAACSLSAGGAPSLYLGKIATFEFTCAADGTVTLRAGNGLTDVLDDAGRFYAESTDESLTVNCVPPQSYPGDTDGDGCPDMREAGPSPYSGGQRNFLNSYDYFNPTHDGQNRIDDILAVVDQYFVDQGNPSYTAGTDRTLIGSNAWTLGPPDGKQRVDDILNALHQYFHDCS